MLFRQFRFNIILRVLILNLTVLGIIWLATQTNYYITTFSLGIVAVVQVGLLINFAERTNMMFVKFLNAIRYDDFSQTYTPKGLGKSFDELNQEFQNVVMKFQEIRAEKEAQYHYLKTIVQHIGIGLIVIDEQENVQLINHTAEKILQVNYLHHIKDLAKTHNPLVQYIQQSESLKKERELIKMQSSDKILHLAARTTKLRLRDMDYRIISLQDIQSELEDKEMEAWQNLIRVLTHEIINSVTPIASLAQTINMDLHEHIENIKSKQQATAVTQENLVLSAQVFQESIDEIHFAVKTIQKRSEGLIRFVKDFRSLTKIPMPQLQTLSLKELVESTAILMKEEFKKHQIQFNITIQPENLPLIADPHLIEQVFINLFKNASHALEGKEQKMIALNAYRENTNKTVIEISDNGAGISEEALKNVFIPFFTTKKSGSGIGLSLSRQVMRFHGGSITVQSVLGEGTIFTLKFP